MDYATVKGILKHAFCAAKTVTECWKLVESEKTILAYS